MTNGDAQLSLGVLSLALNERQQAQLDTALEAAKADQTNPEHTRRKPTRRKPLPDHLPRVTIEVLPPEVEKRGYDSFERIGEELSEVVERRPASFVVARVGRLQFVPKDRERDSLTKVLVAGPLEPSIPRGLAGPGMLADKIVKRQDQCRSTASRIYARRSRACARDDVWLARRVRGSRPSSRRCDARGCRPSAPDATGVLVLTIIPIQTK